MEDPTLEDQVLNPERIVQKVLAAFLGLILNMTLLFFGLSQIRMSDPYVRAVLSQPGEIARGNAIFQLNCAGCHGTLATGKVGPSLRKISTRRSQIGLIHQITSGKTPPMPKFQASPEEMADLLRYLNTL